MTAHALGAPLALLAALLLGGDPQAPLVAHVRLSATERRSLERGDTIARTLDGPSNQVGVFAMSRIDATGETLIHRARAIEDLKRSAFVTGIRRFSDPPVLSDLDDLVLSPRDVDAALNCRSGSCSLKLTAAEINLLRAQAAAGGPDRRTAAQEAFRRHAKFPTLPKSPRISGHEAAKCFAFPRHTDGTAVALRSAEPHCKRTRS